MLLICFEFEYPGNNHFFFFFKHPLIVFLPNVSIDSCHICLSFLPLSLVQQLVVHVCLLCVLLLLPTGSSFSVPPNILIEGNGKAVLVRNVESYVIFFFNWLLHTCIFSSCLKPHLFCSLHLLFLLFSL